MNKLYLARAALMLIASGTTTLSFGQSFGPALAHPGAVVDVDVSPRNSSFYVMSCKRLGSNPAGAPALVRSLDGGVTTETIATYPEAFDGEEIVGVEFSRAGVLYVATRAALFESRDRGTTFRSVWQAPSGADLIFALGLDPFDANSLWLAGRFTQQPGVTMIKSMDAGATWIGLPPLVGAPGEQVVEIRFDTATPARVMVRFGGTLHVTNDAGASFTFASMSSEAQQGGLVLHDGRLLIGAPLRESLDDGATWSGVSGVPFTFRTIAQNALFPERFVVLSDEGKRVFSSDGGQSWNTNALGTFDAIFSESIAIVPDVSQGAGAANDQILACGEGGAAATGVSEPMRGGIALPGVSVIPHQVSRHAFTPTIRIDPANADRLLWKQFLSEDRGATWTRVPQAPSDSSVVSTFGDGGELYFGVLGTANPRYVRVTTAGVAEELALSTGPWPKPPGPFEDVRTRIVCCSSSHYELELSQDAGVTWTMIDRVQVGLGLGTSFYGDVRLRYASTGLQILRSFVLTQSIARSFESYRFTGLPIDWAGIDIGTGPLADVTVNDSFPEIVYAASSNADSATSRSVQYGAGLVPIGLPGIHGQLVRGHYDPQLVIRGVLESIAQFEPLQNPVDIELSRDGGQTWTSISGLESVVGDITLAPDDSYVIVDGRILELGQSLGESECAANVNTSGAAASIRAVGSTSVTENDVVLYVQNAPSFTFGIFATSRDGGLIPNVAGSAGNLCLGGAIGRLSMVPSLSSAGGDFALRIDTSQMPMGSMYVPIAVGETWRYQAWFRDGGTSNQSDAIAITFTP